MLDSDNNLIDIVERFNVIPDVKMLHWKSMCDAPCDEGAYNLLVEMNDPRTVMRMLECLSRVESTYITIINIQQAVATVLCHAHHITRAIRIFCQLGWGDDDGTTIHLVKRIGDGGFNAVDLLRHIGLWAYCGN